MENKIKDVYRIAKNRGAIIDIWQDQHAGACIERGAGKVLLQLHKNFVHIELIEVDEDARGYGIGNELLQDVMAIADELKMTVTLQPVSLLQKQDEAGLAQKDLVAWYGRNGFSGEFLLSRYAA